MPDDKNSVRYKTLFRQRCDTKGNPKGLYGIFD